MLNMDPMDKSHYTTKRSSLKTKHLFPEEMSYEEYINSKSKNIQWEDKVEQIENVKSENHKTDTKSKFDDAKTHFPDIDPSDDLYLHKLHEINKIIPTKDVIEEIKEIVNEDKKKTEKQVDIISEKETKISENDSEKNLKFKNERKRSIKDEFSLAKDLLKVKITQDEELAPELIEETMKNTLYNKCVGKIEFEDSDEEKSD